MSNIVEIIKQGYIARLDVDTGRITSLTDGSFEAVDKEGNFGAVTYTENGAQNIYTHRFVERPEDEPGLVLEDRLSDLHHRGGYSFANDKAELEYIFNDKSIDIVLSADSGQYSQIGLQLDVNFIDKDQSGDYHTQLLPSYFYSSSDGRVKFNGFNTPDGSWLLVTSDTESDGWRICYVADMPHLLGGFQVLKYFDRRLKERKKDGPFIQRVNVSLHGSKKAMLEYVQSRLNIVLPELIVSGCGIGGEIAARVSPAKLAVYDPDGQRVDYTYKDGLLKFVTAKEGFYRIETVSAEGGRADAVAFAFSDWRDMFIRATDAIEKPYHCDFNLCEGAMWLNACLIRQKLFGKDAACETKINEFLDDILSVTQQNVSDADIGKIVPFEHEHKGVTHSAYHTYKLERIQNQVTQALCMLELFKIREDTKYLELAVNYITNIIRDHMCSGGYLICDLTKEDDGTDYTTVTCMLIGFVELSNILRSRNDQRYKDIADTTVKLTDHLVRRGFNFPSEGTQGRHEMEEGSISCTALSLLYTYLFLKKDEKYLSEALKFLQLHDSWVMEVPDVKMYQSTLRWWETNWEGDADGSSINSGHAWTIWKAEADFWYAYATGDMARAVKSFCGYMTNMCKVTPSGKMYTCYTPDYIPGKPHQNRIVHSFPMRYDNSMPYYMWTRAENTWFTAAAFAAKCGEVLCVNTGYAEDKVYKLRPAAIALDKLFFGGADKPVEIETDNAVEIILCDTKIKVISGLLQDDGIRVTVTPDNRKIIFSEEK